MEEAMRGVVAGLFLLLASTVSSHAEILASAPSYQNGQTAIVCQIYNSGTTAVTVSRPEVLAEFSPFSVPLASTNCPTSLAAGRNCVWRATIPTGFSHLCRVQLSRKAAVRGTMTIDNTIARTNVFAMR
jgi:hypothetical protein